MSGLRVDTADGGVRVLTLARPERRNAFTLELVRALRDEVEAAVRDPDVRAVVVTGAGGAFCAGADVGEMGDHLGRLPAHFRDLMEAHHGAIAHLLTTPKPVVTAVDGIAAGGGLGLALAGDVRLGTRAASFRAAFLALGASPDGGSTWLLPLLVGGAEAQRLLYRNPLVDSEEALRLGLVHELVAGDLRQAAVDVARELADLPGAGFRNAKTLLRDSRGGALRAHLDLERDRNAEAAADPALAEAVRAFTERSRAREVPS